MDLTGTLKRAIRLQAPSQSVNGNKEWNTIKTLRKSSDTVFTRSDKSKRIVALDSITYHDMLTSQSENYASAKLVLPSSLQSSFNQKLNAIAKRYSDPVREILAKLTCSEPLPSNLKMLPKDHKDGPLKARPIVAAIDAPATRLSRYLSNILYDLIKVHVGAHIDSTQAFLNVILPMKLNADHKFASLDIVDLYGSIPVDDDFFPGVASVVGDFFDAHKTNTPLDTLSKDDFSSLVRLCLTSGLIQVETGFFRPSKGIPMGNNLSTAAAIIFMDYVEAQIIAQFPGIIKWIRFIDDVFLVYTGIPSDTLLKTCNDVHPSIEFTIEEPTNDCLPYLDVMVRRNIDCFSTTLYVKPSHSGSVIPWTSHHPRHLIINVLRNELRRAIRNGSGPEEKRQGTDIIKQRYLNFGYPNKVINNVLHQLRRQQPRRFETNEERKVFLTLPFISEQQSREVRRALKRCKMQDKLYISFKSRTLSSILCPRRDRICVNSSCIYCKYSSNANDCLTKFCIYFIRCNICSASYVGETCRTVRSRLREHVTCESSHVYGHLLLHTACPDISLISWTIIHSGLRNVNLRKSVELREIRSCRPTINVQCMSPDVLSSACLSRTTKRRGLK